MTRYYITMTWDNFPEGGSFGTVIEAFNHAEAEAKCRREMAETQCEDFEHDPDVHDDDWTFDCEVRETIDNYYHDWNVVDCFDLDGFIEQHKR